MKILLAPGAITGEVEGRSKDSLKSMTVELPLELGDVIPQVEVLSVDFHRASVKITDESCISGEYRARIHCTRAKSQPLQKPLDSPIQGDANKKNVITEVYPFFGIREGSKLSNLRVAGIAVRDGTVCLDLTNRQPNEDFAGEDSQIDAEEKGESRRLEPFFVEQASDVLAGQKVSGIVTAADLRKQGLWLQLGPDVSGFIPTLELSDDQDILNKFQHHFPVGCRIECIAIDRERWHRTRAEYTRPSMFGHRKTDAKSHQHPILLSHLLTKKSKRLGLAKPSCGDIVVGRINRSLRPMLAPALMLELRGGYVGRCCICELEEPDEWINMPLGHFQPEAETAFQQDADKDVDKRNKVDER